MTSFAELPPAEQSARLYQLALNAIPFWALDCVRVEPIKVRENAVLVVAGVQVVFSSRRSTAAMPGKLLIDGVSRRLA